MWETWVRSLCWEDSPGEGNGNPLQYSCLENPMERGAWQATVHGVTKSRTRLSDFTFILMHVNLNIQKTKIMASSPITAWQVDGETVGTVADFIFLGSKITVDGDCSHEIKRCLLLGRKVMTNLNSILKSRDITLPTKVRLVKAMVFPVVIMDMRVGLWRKLSTKELLLLNCGVRGDSWLSLGLQGDPTIPF